jgi:UDP-N-acetylglucosamine--N-acetylmuramyl-(pentapeptide) pyrophosphoryl-undecaprenol N-acetylglucosamine transferase
MTETETATETAGAATAEPAARSAGAPSTAPRVAFAGGGTGGHLYPAVALARALEDLASHTQVLFLGGRRPLERKILAPTGYPHVALPSAPWAGARRAPRFAWEQLKGFVAARRRLREFEADAVVGLGGFVSLPGVLAARSLGVPVALFEPNAVPGRANQLLASLAAEAYVHFDETQLACPVVRCGTPVGPRALTAPSQGEARARLGLPRRGTVILVMGGSQGARPINAWLEASLGAGAAPGRVAFLHLAGNEEAAAELEKAYRAAGQPHVVLPFLHEMGLAYAAADVAVVRAGGATLAEVTAAGLPALAVPLPNSAGDHQRKNARAYAASGAGRWIEQNDLSPSTLRQLVAEARDPVWLERCRRAAREGGRPDAARSVARRVLRLCGKPHGGAAAPTTTTHTQLRRAA